MFNEFAPAVEGYKLSLRDLADTSFRDKVIAERRVLHVSIMFHLLSVKCRKADFIILFL